GTFNGPFDHVTAEPLIREALMARIQGDHEGYVAVSPDGGRAKATEHYAEELGIDVIHMPKSRDRSDSSRISRPDFMAGVKDRICLLTDDMIDTAGTICSAAEVLHDSAARGVIIAATHGIFSHPALDRLQRAPIDEIIVTDTIPTDDA